MAVKSHMQSYVLYALSITTLAVSVQHNIYGQDLNKKYYCTFRSLLTCNMFLGSKVVVM